MKVLRIKNDVVPFNRKNLRNTVGLVLIYGVAPLDIEIIDLKGCSRFYPSSHFKNI